jgi:prepilin-type N-terminal cleavage/methylation domain-containing protein
MKQYTNQKGFTLIELSVVLIILTLIIGAILGMRSLIESARISNAQNLTANSPVLDTDNLVFWYETSMINKNIKAGQEISTTLKDLSPNQFIINPTAGMVYKDSEILQGLKTLNFDGSRCLSTSNYINATNYTVFAVIKANDTTAGNLVFHNGSGVTHSQGWGLTVGEASITGSSRTIAVVNNADTPTKTVYINNDTGSGLTADTPEEFAGGFYVGCKNAGNYFTGEIAEIIVFNRTLFSYEISEIRNYLQKKYLLTFN